jgi:hypothetical protein
VYQTTKVYGQQSVTSGEYKSAGEGKGQFRYNVRISVGETTQDVLQVSDGKLMWTQVGLDQAPKRVILDQILQSLSNAIPHADTRPEVNIYLAIGGHAELLRGLYHRYNWYKAARGKLGGVDVWQLVGRLRTEPPKLSGHTLLDDSNLKMGDATRKLPPEVRLTLSRSANLAYFPYAVEYLERTRDAKGQTVGIELVTQIKHLDPTTSVNLNEQEFQYRVSDSIDKIEDETNLYLPTAPIAGLQPFPAR